MFRGGYGLNYNQEEIAISANISNNPGLVVFPSLRHVDSPTSPNPDIIYAVSTDPHNLYGYPANPNTISTLWPEWTANQRLGRRPDLSRARFPPCASITTRSICNTIWVINT